MQAIIYLSLLRLLAVGYLKKKDTSRLYERLRDLDVSFFSRYELIKQS